MSAEYIGNFQLMAKPGGSLCNLTCDYCFYLEKEKLYPESKMAWRMNDVTLENYIKKTIAAQDANIVDFLWQGGEPTLTGIAFYERVVHLQIRYAGVKTINNYFQTNGINIDDKWAAFFKHNNFLVGVSIDGNRLHHDRHRKTTSGKSSFDAVMAGIAALKRHGVAWNTLTVINAENVKFPLDIYHFLKRIGSRYMQFIPVVERISAQPDEHGLTLVSPDYSGSCQVAEWSVPAKEWGEFLNALFDHWMINDLGSIFIMNFEQMLSKIKGHNSSCILNETCGENLVIESNGDIYSCDHFVFPDYCIGNINHDVLKEVVNSSKNKSFGQKKRIAQGSSCNYCEYLTLCNGGCPKYRFIPDKRGGPPKNYFCKSIRMHLEHVLPKSDFILMMLDQQVSAKRIRKQLKARFGKA